MKNNMNTLTPLLKYECKNMEMKSIEEQKCDLALWNEQCWQKFLGEKKAP